MPSVSIFGTTVKRSDGSEEIETITMPLITVIPMCQTCRSLTVKYRWMLRSASSAEFKDNIEAGGELEGQGGLGAVSLQCRIV